MINFYYKFKVSICIDWLIGTLFSNMETCDYLQYKTEKNGVVETRVEQRFTVSLEGQDDFDYDSVSSAH